MLITVPLPYKDLRSLDSKFNTANSFATNIDATGTPFTTAGGRAPGQRTRDCPHLVAPADDRRKSWKVIRILDRQLLGNAVENLQEPRMRMERDRAVGQLLVSA
jgi:hypothetical protein